ncbi:hypothetical protein Q8A73_000632 [Channa argus]|nr:hypothetical protein Q8A73_000632 [Channa argus]
MDSARPALRPLSSTNLSPGTKQHPLIQPGPRVLLRKSECWGGGGKLLAVIIYIKERSGPQWEGQQRCRIFLNEITPCTPLPDLPASTVLGPDWSSLRIADVSQALLWMSPSAASSILPPITLRRGISADSATSFASVGWDVLREQRLLGITETC